MRSTQDYIEAATVLHKKSRKAARLASYCAVDSTLSKQDGHVLDLGDAWVIYAKRPEQSVKVKKNQLRPAINQMLQQMVENKQRYWGRPSLLDIKLHVDQAAEDVLLASPPVAAKEWESDYQRLEELLAEINM